MNEYEEKKTVQNAMNRALSGLKENPFLVQRIIATSKGEKVVGKKRLSIGFVFAMVVVFATITALAVSLVFSPRYDAKRLANQALKDQYGITDEMMTVFNRRDTQAEPDGSRVFTYKAMEDIYANQIGVYTVTVKDGKTSAVWSHDGEDTTGGIQADAWGAEQIAMLCSDQYGEVLAQLSGHLDAPAANSTTVPQRVPDPISAEDAAAIEAEALAEQAAWEKGKAQIMTASKISLDEAYRLAVSAVSSEFGLNATQCGQFVFDDEPDGATYRFMDGQPVVDLFLRLTQKEDATHTEKDGIYVVSVNMDDGVIEDTVYDSGLAANE